MNKLNLILATLLVTMATACVNLDDFETPDLTETPVQLDGPVVTIASVLGNFAQSENGLYTFSGSDSYMEGYVISSDEAGNFFEELIVQDAPENPTAGIGIQVDVSPLFTRYELGRKVYIRLEGLTVAEDNGTVQLGIRDGQSIGPIPRAIFEQHIIRSTETAEIVPLPIAIDDFSDDVENLFVKLENVQFANTEFFGDLPSTFAANPDDEFDGERLLVSCNSAFTTVVSTSTFSDFKSLTLPEGNGSVEGVLSRDFFDDFFILQVNLPNAVQMYGERCAQAQFTCEHADLVGETVIFSDNFETERTNRAISKNGWTNYVEAGSETWEAYSSTSSNASLGISARVGAFGTGDRSNIAWLVTPPMELDTLSNINLQFKTSTSFADGSVLQPLISTDWDSVPENIPLAKWEILEDAYIAQNSDDFTQFYSSGTINLSCASGTAYIAFKYIGNTRLQYDGTYELDDILITGD
ncbi:MAG: DUF5689 domain-containing protein [Leeuwenhoekiella sp.]